MPRAIASLRHIPILWHEEETKNAKATCGARNYPKRALKLAGLTIS